MKTEWLPLHTLLETENLLPENVSCLKEFLNGNRYVFAIYPGYNVAAIKQCKDGYRIYVIYGREDTYHIQLKCTLSAELEVVIKILRDDMKMAIGRFSHDKERNVQLCRVSFEKKLQIINNLIPLWWSKERYAEGNAETQCLLNGVRQIYNRAKLVDNDFVVMSAFPSTALDGMAVVREKSSSKDADGCTALIRGTSIANASENAKSRMKLKAQIIPVCTATDCQRITLKRTGSLATGPTEAKKTSINW